MEKKTIWDLNRVSVDEYKTQIDKLPIVVVLDNIRSLNNVGSVFRTADAFLISKIMLCGITATPPNNDIHKTALGAEDSVAWQYFESTIDCVNRLKEEGYTLCCLEQVKDSVALQDFVVEEGKKYAIIFGNEVNGVDQEVVNACDVCIEIPQCGTKHSLNVSVSGGIAMWHFFDALHN
ncbi:MAG: RNA methyltransferase [Muribaculaceae bacterium]|nr:RNA methyltransferase [Muribaculaceae bacterium]